MPKHIYVVAGVITDKEKILCVQRGPNNLLALKWEFPGGKIEKDETSEEALQREIKEEMLCEIDVGSQIDETVYEYDFGIVHLSTYSCKLVKGTPTLTEHAALKWLSSSELPSLDWAPADLPTVRKLMEQEY
ncbi:(deoxy)nucleoside triphosphate pyrophosphohydrolase [Bacillus timonensis]|uniref:(deoxy)nucleoside triphosphate pyrophosphohydrolase n=1 Tax=Bacillus timonensis TaxID=1033734 RepID=UPI000289E06B|nr:(deoxy)nucleoside triphosphate pyrophosphohydrolase [Bacillus timonensis]